MPERVRAEKGEGSVPSAAPGHGGPDSMAVLGSAGNGAVSRLLQPLSGAPAGLPALRGPVPSGGDLTAAVAMLTGRPVGRLATSDAAQDDVREHGRELHAGWSALGTGRTLTAAERGPAEQSYGYDLSGVRAHDGSAAAQVARSLGAHALTLGKDIILGGSPTPVTWAHELAHVVQQRDASPLGGLRGADPSSAGEADAGRAAAAVQRGDSYDPISVAHQEYQAIPVPLLLFLIGVAAAGAYAAFAAPSYEDNQRERAANANHLANSTWLSFVPGVGSAIHVQYAEGGFERWFSVLCFGLDVATLGMAGSAYLKTTAMWRAAGGTIAQAESEQLAAAGVRAVTEDVRNEAMRTALEHWRPVAVFRGGENHAEVWVRVGENTVRRLHGGPLARIFARNSAGFGRVAATERMTSIAGDEALDAMISKVHAYSVLDVPGARAAVLAEADRIATQGLGWTARSCGVTQSQLVRSIPGLESVVPASRSMQFLPIEVMGHMSEEGALRLVAGHARPMWFNGQLALAAAPVALGRVIQGAHTWTENQLRSPAGPTAAEEETVTMDQFLARMDAGGGPTVDLRSVPDLLNQMSNPDAGATPVDGGGLTASTDAMLILTVPPPPGVVPGAPALLPEIARIVDDLAAAVRPPVSPEARDRTVARVTERFPMSLPDSSVELVRGRLREQHVDPQTADEIAAKLLLNR